MFFIDSIRKKKRSLPRLFEFSLFYRFYRLLRESHKSRSSLKDYESVFYKSTTSFDNHWSSSECIRISFVSGMYGNEGRGEGAGVSGR